MALSNGGILSVNTRMARWVRIVCVALIAGILLAAAPFSIPATSLAAVGDEPVRVYTFAEVGEIAKNNASEIIRQKAAVKQAEQNKESQLSSYQNQVYNYYSNSDSGISESSLFSLQDSYESAFNSFVDAEETLDKLKPKVAYQAQKLYIDILQGEVQMRIQEKEIQRLKDEYELAKAKTAFGALTQTQLGNAKAQWESAVDTLENLQNTMKTNRNNMREYLSLAETAEFGLESPPIFGQYAKAFDEAEVLAEALKNSLSLKQAKREVDELSERIRRYESQGEQSQADRLAASGPGKDLALKETTTSLTRTVENTMKDFRGLDAAVEKAQDTLNASRKTLNTTMMKLSMGTATINDKRIAERAALTAEKDLAQAQYNCYLGAMRVILLKDGILV
jgi:outer membrane protein TolC